MRFERLADHFLAMVELAMMERLPKALLPDTAQYHDQSDRLVAEFAEACRPITIRG